ncbi:GPI-GlcNAc transferase complex, PIG-H component [Musa troglodytarum]|uniref:GPI-GlcNAc transferase complex, PIG-H component n=1 Tax=Musa troglodytarum TaxID=320322 RepID=A0A9E7HVG8_9LILI|nr:GPI-GlcNAc transferase complex, PIG-H component [Musa troglodytarum]
MGEAVLRRRPRVSVKSVRDGTMMVALLNLPCPGPSELDRCHLSPMNQIAVHVEQFIHGIPDEQGATEVDKMVNPSCKGIKYSSKHPTAGWEVWFPNFYDPWMDGFITACVTGAITGSRSHQMSTRGEERRVHPPTSSSRTGLHFSRPHLSWKDTNGSNNIFCACTARFEVANAVVV